jgi:DNA-binding MarR family transcriptional regulator
MTIQKSAVPIKSRGNASTEFARDVFAWQEQIHTDRATFPNAKPISHFDFRLAYAITQYTNKHSRKAWPSQEKLAADLGVDLRTVSRGITNLVKRGHLSVTRRGREQSAIYRMILQDRTSLSDHDEARHDTGVVSKEVRHDTDVVSKPQQDTTSVSSRHDTVVLKTRHPCRTEPLMEPLLEPEERGAPPARPAAGASNESSLNSKATTIDDGDDGSGVAWRAPPPDQEQLQGNAIDQDGMILIIDVDGTDIWVPAQDDWERITA